jgi:FKBP-type peptidyl-prolyl cis-trans isomerase SlpA
MVMARTAIIGPGMKVKLNFAILLDTGDLIDSTRGKPAEFVIGDGNVLPGFEKAMFGLTSGETRSLQIPAAMGFGEHNPDNVKNMLVSDFPGDIELTEGLAVSFADMNRNELPGVVESVLGDRVTINFNHPLAGRDLVFEVEILNVEKASNEIIRVSE